MKVTEETIVYTLNELNGWEVPVAATRQARTLGEGIVHQSEIIRDIALRGGIIKEREGDEMPTMLLACGLAWEAWMAGMLPGMLWQPAERSLDGVYMNLDGLSFTEDGDLIVEEFKYTRKSSNKPIAGEWMWLAQVKCYCKAMSTLHARLHVMFASGDYKFGEDSGLPTYKRYGFEFEQVEVDDNWGVILRGKQRLEAK